MEVDFCELKKMVSAENIQNYPDWEISLTAHTGASDLKLGDVIIKIINQLLFFQ